MIQNCHYCEASFDDEFRFTYCPHDLFLVNDGNNNFRIHEESELIKLRVINLDKVSIYDIKKYIRSKHSILWQNWYVTDPKGLEKAAEWVKSLLSELHAGLSGIESGGN